jgi:hypothetical protein
MSNMPNYMQLYADAKEDKQFWIERSKRFETTLRDHFATAAMQDILASEADLHRDCYIKGIASQAYKQADAMLAEREKIHE